MPGQYTVSTEPVQDRSYPNKHGGNLVVWRVGLQDARSVAEDGLFELHKKEGNEPQLGDVLDVARTQEGEFNGSPFTRLFLAKPQDAPQGGSSYSTGGKSPDQQRSIVRQHSQEMALRFVAMTGDAKDMNFADPSVVSAYLSETVRRLTDWFYKDAAAAQEAAGGASNGSQQEIPADTSGWPTAPAAATAADDSIPF